jgi:hypothetical protein
MNDQRLPGGAGPAPSPVRRLEQALSDLQATLRHIEQVLDAKRDAGANHTDDGLGRY